jgi:3-isopropylmalate/(R)-2-methylmalate dehydratase small subunit
MQGVKGTMKNPKGSVKFEGRGIPLEGDDIDTDRIIPARFMKCLTFEGLGPYAFYDERFDAQGGEKSHALNDQRYSGGEILIVGRNFGCGSSREHAPQSLKGFGVQVFIGESFAEIFAGNCTSMGLPVVTLSAGEVKQLRDQVRKNPELLISIDLEAKTVAAGGITFPLEIPDTYRRALMSGTWNSTNILLSHREGILCVEKGLPYRFAGQKGYAEST